MAQPSRKVIVPQGISAIRVPVPWTVSRHSLNEHETPGSKSGGWVAGVLQSWFPPFVPRQPSTCQPGHTWLPGSSSFLTTSTRPSHCRRKRARAQEEGTGDLLRAVAAEAQRGAPPKSARGRAPLACAAAERRMAMREAGTWEIGSMRHSGTNTRLRLGPPGWCDTGG